MPGLQMPTGDLAAAQQNPKYDQQGMLIPGTGGLPAGGWSALPSQPSYAPLPQVSPQAPQQQDTGGSPVDKFNTALLQLLQGAQTAANDPTLLNERNRLGVQQIGNSMAPAGQMGIDNLAPGAALNARQNEGKLYNPEINNLTDRIQASAQAVSNFEKAIDTARSFGENYAKTVQVDDATVQAVKDQMKAGFLPSASVIEKLGKYLTTEDWNALAEAKKTTDPGGSQPADVAKYEYYKAQEIAAGRKPMEFTEYDDRQSQYKKPSGSTTNNYIAGDPIADKNEARVKEIIANHPRTAPEYKYDLEAWKAAAEQINSEFKDPNAATKYDDRLKAAYGKFV